MSYCDSHVQSLMPVADSVQRLLASELVTEQTETLGLDVALGRILAEDQRSTVNVPSFDNSAMDGYAVDIEALKNTHKLPLCQRIIAGDSALEALTDGTCARIFTGAPIPPQANAVVMQEQCEITEEAGKEFVVFPKSVKLHQNIRPLGQDIGAGNLILEKGVKLRAQELGVLASIGVGSVMVYQKLIVAVISTGNELVEPGRPLNSGAIYNSNHYTILGMLQDLGFDTYDCGTVKDDLSLIKDSLLNAAEKVDCILTSGGVSVGEEDYVKLAVEEVGQLDLWKVAIKPGKPFAFGRINKTPFIGLPGNPSAVFVTFHILAKPFLQKLQGIRHSVTPVLFAQADFEVIEPSSCEQYLFVRATKTQEGGSKLIKYPNQSSGILSSCSWASGFAKIPTQKTVAKGDLIEFIAFVD